MNDAFELVDPRNAQAYLQRFPLESKRQGEACFRRGKVESLVPKEPGRDFVVHIADGEPREVRLNYRPPLGWLGQCTCAKESDCEHVVAAMHALLAEHSAAAVRKLSATLPGLSLSPAVPPKSETLAAEDLTKRLLASTGGPLTREQTSFIKRVREAYTRCRQMRQITPWDFQQMGFPFLGGGWNMLKIWPAFPESDFEFWLYVANAALKEGFPLPGFMEPITDLSLIDERLARWEREKEIDRWKATLGGLELRPPSASSLAAVEMDLRLAVHGNEVRLQWHRAGQAAFEPIKQIQLRKLAEDYENGLVRFTPEAELLWQALSNRDFSYGPTARLDFDDDDAPRILGPLLRGRLLEGRIVDDQGVPLLRVPEPLRWQMTPAANERDDYRFSLVQADGPPPPPVLFVVHGNPTLYLTPKAIFTGPDPQESVLDPSQETRIPAPALERAPGVALLQSLGLELPPRLATRVRKLPYQVAIHCELKPSFPGSDTEECVLKIQAQAPDQRQLVWTGYAWLDRTPKAGRKKSGSGNEIVIYESALLHAIPTLLEPLNARPSSYPENALMVRLSRKFPETFAAWLKSLPPAVTVELAGELASFNKADVAGRVKLDVTEAEIDWFDLRVVLDVADTTLTPAEIKLLLNAKGRYVRLTGKGWRRLQYDLTEQEDERLARLGLSPRELSAEPQRLHALQLADDAARKFLPEPQVEQIQRRVSELKTRVAPDLPVGVTAHLRPYQLEGFHFLAYLTANRFGGILADDMGLGKTLQTLAWLLWLRENQQNPETASRPALPADALPSLVVCPKSVMDNWHAEAARFTPGLRVKVWTASELDRLSDQLTSADLHVLNYSQLRMLGESLRAVRWLAVILDEGQYIKNPASQTAQVARALKAGHRLVLSGTPIENRLLDLWSLMAFAMPGVLSNRAQFARLYDAKGDPLARRRLASRVRPFVLRRTKAQVAGDLPDRIEEDLFCEIEGEQKALYRAELKRAQQLLLSITTQHELAQQQFHFLTCLLRLRQICCHPRLLKPDSPHASAKTDALLEQLEPLMEEGQKVLVFSQFVEMLNLLRPAITERQWPLFYLAGDTENRGELVKQFQSAQGAAVFLISLKAGGFGLNLTAASYVVLFDPWWNPAVENQAIDRTHRIGQTNKVIAYRLLIKDSIEGKIRELQKQKRALAEDVLGEEKFAQSLTLNDLKFLFAD